VELFYHIAIKNAMYFAFLGVFGTLCGDKIQYSRKKNAGIMEKTVKSGNNLLHK
jgi:hypothetical protein